MYICYQITVHDPILRNGSASDMLQIKQLCTRTKISLSNR